MKPGRQKKMVEKYMLDNLIHKYKNNDVEEVIFRLKYAGKFIIMKGKTLCGSLIILRNTYNYYNPEVSLKKNQHKDHLYVHLYSHYYRNPGHRFTIKIFAKKDRTTGQYELLKREQMELDKNMKNQLCLNNQDEPYIPNYNESTGKYGWIEKSAVMSFRRWQTSKERAAYLKRYCK